MILLDIADQIFVQQELGASFGVVLVLVLFHRLEHYHRAMSLCLCLNIAPDFTNLYWHLNATSPILYALLVVIPIYSDYIHYVLFLFCL